MNEGIWREFQARGTSLNPRILDSIFDDINYFLNENDESLRPGILVECVGNRSESGQVTENVLSNIDVKIKKGDIDCFIVALHDWDAMAEKNIYHGENKIEIIRVSINEDIELIEMAYSF